MQYDKNNSHFNQLSDDDKILIAKILDMAEACESKYVSKFTFFLDERQCNLAENILKSVKFDNYLFYGGFDNAKRKVLGLFSQYEIPNEDGFPIAPVKFSYRKMDKLAHKDFLGAMMSHQIKRDILGDILVDEGSAVAFIYNTVAELLINEIDKIGSVGVKISRTNSKDFTVKEDFKIISGTVSALRVDCIFSFATKLSREKAVLLIKSIGIDINHEKFFSVSEVLKLGDAFSLRGYGKFILTEIGGTSKKGKIHISINKYI